MDISYLAYHASGDIFALCSFVSYTKQNWMCQQLSRKSVDSVLIQKDVLITAAFISLGPDFNTITEEDV